MAETMRINGADVPHNTVKWRVCTNRHTTTAGNSWGWIEGAPGNICWSNDSESFNLAKASEVCRIHNQWLEEQKPIQLRIVEAESKTKRLQKVHEQAYSAMERARVEWMAALDILSKLQDKAAKEI